MPALKFLLIERHVIDIRIKDLIQINHKYLNTWSGTVTSVRVAACFSFWLLEWVLHVKLTHQASSYKPTVPTYNGIKINELEFAFTFSI